MIPGRPYSFIAAIEPGRTSWTRIHDVERLRPGTNETTLTATPLRRVIDDVTVAGHWTPGDPSIVVLFDAGYDTARLTWLLTDLPIAFIRRLHSDRVLCFDPDASTAGTGRPARHGAEFRLNNPTERPDPAARVFCQLEAGHFCDN